MGATSKSKRERFKEVCKKTKKCPHCPPHAKENEGKKPRSDKHKNKRKGK